MAASIDLSDLVPDLVSEVNVPGSDGFPSATNSEWLAKLRNAFWEAVLFGLISGYTEDEGVVSPDSGTTALSRELQQVVILYAGMNVIRNQLRQEIKTMARYKAGPVEYETQQSAQVLKGLLDDMSERLKFILLRLSDSYSTATYYIDSFIAREQSINDGYSYWIRG